MNTKELTAKRPKNQTYEVGEQRDVYEIQAEAYMDLLEKALEERDEIINTMPFVEILQQKEKEIEELRKIKSAEYKEGVLLIEGGGAVLSKEQSEEYEVLKQSKKELMELLELVAKELDQLSAGGSSALGEKIWKTLKTEEDGRT